ncbi:MAG TPA: sugar phosphate isomerase/epimerase [Gaiellaceae bacterium]|nr:sugar phosphate isomerase/epimerase [Gaiellaceae bacterium]
MERSKRLASAPVTWGVWERTTDRDDLIPAERLLRAVADLGFTGIELGPPHYLSPEQLEAAGLDLVGGFAPLHLTDPEAFRQDLVDWVDPIADVLAATGARGPIVLADAETPDRVAAAGRTEEQRRTALRGDALKRALELVQEAAERCRAKGVGAVFHHHTATHFESPDEIRSFVEGTDVPLCFDTGHCAVGGGDPLELARELASHIGHLHLKDVDPRLLDRVRTGAIPVEQAWGEGLFCPMGEGMVDVGAVLALPELQAFDGWIVLEQDRVAVSASDLEAVAAVEARNLEHVKAALPG